MRLGAVAASESWVRSGMMCVLHYLGRGRSDHFVWNKLGSGLSAEDKNQNFGQLWWMKPKASSKKKITERKTALAKAALNAKLATETIDVSLVG